MHLRKKKKKLFYRAKAKLIIVVSLETDKQPTGQMMET